jgi:hypothetical protein
VLLEFKSGRHPLMLATDVAARGLGRRGWGGGGSGKRSILSTWVKSVSAYSVSQNSGVALHAKVVVFWGACACMCVGVGKGWRGGQSSSSTGMGMLLGGCGSGGCLQQGAAVLRSVLSLAAPAGLCLACSSSPADAAATAAVPPPLQSACVCVCVLAITSSLHTKAHASLQRAACNGCQTSAAVDGGNQAAAAAAVRLWQAAPLLRHSLNGVCLAVAPCLSCWRLLLLCCTPSSPLGRRPVQVWQGSLDRQAVYQVSAACSADSSCVCSISGSLNSLQRASTAAVSAATHS